MTNYQIEEGNFKNGDLYVINREDDLYIMDYWTGEDWDTIATSDKLSDIMEAKADREMLLFNEMFLEWYLLEKRYERHPESRKS